MAGRALAGLCAVAVVLFTATYLLHDREDLVSHEACRRFTGLSTPPTAETIQECDCKRPPSDAVCDPLALPHEKDKDEIVVVMWDNTLGTPFYWGDGPIAKAPNYAGFDIVKEECPVKCTFSKDRSMVTVADALLFDVCWYGVDPEWRERPPYMPERREGQPWIWFTYEQPDYFNLMKEAEYMRLFDLEMTYNSKSFVQITYMCPWGHKEFANLRDPAPPKAPDKLAAFVASNCGSGGAEERTDYVRTLMKYMQVDSFGVCLHNAEIPEGLGWHTHFGTMMDIKMHTIAQYKFFLAFENTDKVDDYVTEKLMNAFLAGTVPVYRGSSTISQWIPSNHSIIDVRDFPSPEVLARYLVHLNAHEEEYQKYFAWKKDPFPPRFQKLLDGCVFFAECRLCKALHERRSRERNEQPLLNTSVSAGTIDAYALEFNRIDTRIRQTEDFVQVRHSESLDLEDEYTIMAWINLNMVNDGRIVDKAKAGAVDGYEFDVYRCSQGRGHIRLCAGGICHTGKRELRRGIWYHAAVSFSSRRKRGVRFYVNGKRDGEESAVRPTERNAYNLRLGNPATGASGWRPIHKPGVFDGMIDDVSIWKRVLPPREIKASMFKRFTGREEGLSAYWGFNEGTGDVAHDASPNENHAALRGAVRWIPSVSKPLLDISTVESM